MKKIVGLIASTFIILSLPVGAKTVFGEFAATTHWNSMTESGWNCTDRTPGGATIDTGANTPDPSSALKFTYPSGWHDAQEPAMCWFMFPNQASEFSFQYYFKYSSNYSWHGVDNKQTYFIIGSNKSTNFYISVTGDQHISLVTQTFSTDRFFPNKSYNPTIERNRWYKVTLHSVINTAGRLDGVAQVWLDDQLVIDYSDVGYRSSSQSGLGFTEADISPVYGGSAGLVKPATDYQWYDLMTVSTSDIGPIPVGKMPNPPIKLLIQ